MKCRGITLACAALVGSLVGLGGCGGGSSSPTGSSVAPTPAPNYTGTWAATLGNGSGSFTFVVSGTSVTSLTYTFSHTASSGGGSCTTTVTCPAGALCANPTTATIVGNTLTLAREGAYSGSGTFGSASAAEGSFTYSITSSCVSTTQTTTWTAAKS